MKKNLNNRGQSLIEYMLIVAIMAIGTLSVLRIVGENTAVKFAEISNVLAGEKNPKVDSGTAKATKQHYGRKDLSNFMDNTGDN
jgi:pilus assembly protein Flp/PilA